MTRTRSMIRSSIVVALGAACSLDTDVVSTTSANESATSTSSPDDLGSSSTGSVAESSSSAVATEVDSSSGEPPPSGTGFLSPIDAGSRTYECDTWYQDCPAGQKCMPWSDDGASSWNATRCVPIDPDAVAVGETCSVVESGLSGLDDCERHAMCWHVNGTTNMGTCVALCQGSEHHPVCTDPLARCRQASEGTLALCLYDCDPLSQDCNAGQACIPVDDRFICAPDASGDDGVFGDPCPFLNLCDPGLFCAEPDDVPGCLSEDGCCSTLCDLDDPDASATCPGFADGQQCVPWYEEGHAAAPLDRAGACVVP